MFYKEVGCGLYDGSYPCMHDVQNTAIHSVGGQLLADTLEEIKAMNRAMAGFKGTLPQYQNRVEAGAPHRSLVKQGPLIKFSRTEKSLRFFYLVCYYTFTYQG